MSRKKYDIADPESVQTLCLPVDFGKLKPNQLCEDAYAILSAKERGKARYVTEAVFWYELKCTRSTWVRRSVQRQGIARTAARLYGITTEQAAKNLFAMTPESAVYKAISDSIPPRDEARKMLLGFNTEDDEHVKLYKRLREMTVNERVQYISDVVFSHVCSGRDMKMKEMLASRYLLSMADMYGNQKTDEGRDSVLKEFMQAVSPLA